MTERPLYGLVQSGREVAWGAGGSLYQGVPVERAVELPCAIRQRSSSSTLCGSGIEAALGVLKISP